MATSPCRRPRRGPGDPPRPVPDDGRVPPVRDARPGAVLRGARPRDDAPRHRPGGRRGRVRGRRCARTTRRSPPTAATTTRSPAGPRWAALYAELFGRADGLHGRQGRLDAHHQRRAPHDGRRTPSSAPTCRSRSAPPGPPSTASTEQVAVCFFGDGTTNIGAFHEALNLAAVWKAPVVFVCENNQYMEYTAIGSVTAVARPAADRAAAYGLEPIVVDGNDADAVYEVAMTALARARAGEGPSLIEALTYRHGGHSRADPGKYRPDDEVQAWLAKDPIPTYRARLEAAGVDVADPGRDRCRRGGQGRRGRAGGAQCAGARPGGARDPGLGRRRLLVAELTYRAAMAAGDRPGDGARPVGRAARRGRRRGRRRVQADRGPVRPVRARARP